MSTLHLVPDAVHVLVEPEEDLMNPFRILVTGSRDWDDVATLRDAIDQVWRDAGSPPDAVLVHGDCPTGADAHADMYWRALGRKVEAHAAEWGKYGRSAGPIRNNHMVSLGADVCVAFPLGKSVGTRGCMKAAKAAGIPVVVIPQGQEG